MAQNYEIDIKRFNGTDYDTLLPTPASHALTHLPSGSDPIWNYNPGMVNPNLLDNWYFGNPVNQRGFSSISGAYWGYSIDRWIAQVANDGTANDYITLNGGYITVSSNTAGTNTYANILQLIEPNLSAALVGKTITASILTSEGLFSSTITAVSDTYYVFYAGSVCSYILYVSSSTRGEFYIRANAGAGTVNVIAAKLELGSQQTLARQENGVWVLNEIPEYGEQLARCQRYYYPIDSESYLDGIKVTGNVFSVPFWLPVTMRSLPSFIGTLQVFSQAEGWRTATGAVVVQKSANRYDIVDGSLSYIENTNYIVKGISAFSADL